MLKWVVIHSSLRRIKRRVSQGKQRLHWHWTVRLNQIPEHWHQVAVTRPYQLYKDKLVSKMDCLKFTSRSTLQRPSKRTFRFTLSGPRAVACVTRTAVFWLAVPSTETPEGGAQVAENPHGPIVVRIGCSL